MIAIRAVYHVDLRTTEHRHPMVSLAKASSSLPTHLAPLLSHQPDEFTLNVHLI